MVLRFSGAGLTTMASTFAGLALALPCIWAVKITVAPTSLHLNVVSSGHRQAPQSYCRSRTSGEAVRVFHVKRRGWMKVLRCSGTRSVTSGMHVLEYCPHLLPTPGNQDHLCPDCAPPESRYVRASAIAAELVSEQNQRGTGAHVSRETSRMDEGASALRGKIHDVRHACP